MAREERFEPESEKALRENLYSMEARVRKLRDTRNNFNTEAKAVAEQRNSIQKQYKDHREKHTLLLAEMKALRAEINVHKEKRNALQAQRKDLINQSQGRKKEKGEKQTASAEYIRLKGEIANLESTFETTSVSKTREDKIMSDLKRMKQRVHELEPEVGKFEMVKLDLSDLDVAIKTLSAEADASHQLMLEVIAKADELKVELDDSFSHRDFLKAEGDRLHEESVGLREKANQVHEKIDAMMVEVNQTREQLNLSQQERESWMTDHNKKVKTEMKTGAESEEVATSLIDTLLSEGTLIMGGLGVSDYNEQTPKPKKAKKSKVNVGAMKRK
ncbi:MAG: hypothetical protein VW230_02965 [Candidatus Poseidoniales archaeon]